MKQISERMHTYSQISYIPDNVCQHVRPPIDCTVRISRGTELVTTAISIIFTVISPTSLSCTCAESGIARKIPLQQQVKQAFEQSGPRSVATYFRLLSEKLRFTLNPGIEFSVLPISFELRLQDNNIVEHVRCVEFWSVRSVVQRKERSSMLDKTKHRTK